MNTKYQKDASCYLHDFTRRTLILCLSFQLTGVMLLIAVIFLTDDKQTGLRIAPSVFIAAFCLAQAIYLGQYLYRPLYITITALRHLGQNGVDTSLLKEIYRSRSKEVLVRNIDLLGLRLNDEMADKLLVNEAKLNALQRQINPHFLYNTLDVIRSHAISNGIDDIANMTEALSTIFRYNINRPGGDLVTVKEELENVDCYIVIQQYRFNNKFNIVRKYDPTDQQLMLCLLPRLTIQPIVENALHHGLEKKPGGGTVIIRAITTEKRMLLEISDDGVGISEEDLEAINGRLLEGVLGMAAKPNEDGKKDAGIAIANIHKRIQLHFGHEYGLFISSTKGHGTIIEMTVPLRYKNSI